MKATTAHQQSPARIDRILAQYGQMRLKLPEASLMKRALTMIAERHSLERLKSDVVSLISTATLLCAAVSASSLLRSELYILKLIQEFQLQYAMLCAVGLLVALSARRKRLAGSATLGLLLSGVYTAPYVLPKGPVDPNLVATPIRLLAANVRTENVHSADLVATVEDLKPDVAVFTETDETWISALDSIRTLLPYSHALPREDNFGLVVFSRFPLDETLPLTGPGITTPTLVVKLRLSYQTLSLIAVHPLPPADANLAELRDRQLQEISRFIKTRSTPWIVMGDLNTTPWSAAGRQFLRSADLEEARKGFGPLATWPSFLGPFGIPLDHILLSRNLVASEVYTVPIRGSDHLGLFAVAHVPDTKSEFALP
ncbi:MAG: endonuclease/exonuclease/phosphatase family protein [Bdellovibrionota bacterium]